MKQLKICVERAVRPLRANNRRKDRMREELLAHLQELYHEELARLIDPSAALDQAMRRFGDPAELRRELQDSVPLLERWLFVPVGPRSFQRFERRLSRPGENESALRFALRQTGWSALWMGILCLMFAILYLSAVLGLSRPVRPARETIPVVIASTTLTLLFTLLLPLLTCGMHGAMQERRERRRSAMKIVAYGLLGAVSVFAIGLGCGVLLSKQLQFGSQWLWGLTAVTVLTPLFSAFVARVWVSEARRYRDWESLEIDQ